MARTFLCKIADVKADGLREVAVDGDKKVCVINTGGGFYACQAYCPHQGIPLCEAALDGTTLTCLEHLWQWELPSGEPTGLAEAPIEMVQVEVDGDSLYLKG